MASIFLTQKTCLKMNNVMSVCLDDGSTRRARAGGATRRGRPARYQGRQGRAWRPRQGGKYSGSTRTVSSGSHNPRARTATCCRLCLTAHHTTLKFLESRWITTARGVLALAQTSRPIACRRCVLIYGGRLVLARDFRYCGAWFYTYLSIMVTHLNIILSCFRAKRGRKVTPAQWGYL